MRILIAIVLLLVLSVAGYEAYLHFNPSAKLRAMTARSLDGFSAALATKDRKRITASLDELLTDDAHIRLEVHFFNLNAKGAAGQAEDFSKPDFLTFMDNTLYSLEDYSFHWAIRSFTPNELHNGAQLSILGEVKAEGLSYYAGTGVAMSYTAETGCDATATFENGGARLSKVDCTLVLHSAPKSGKGNSLDNALKNFTP